MFAAALGRLVGSKRWAPSLRQAGLKSEWGHWRSDRCTVLSTVLLRPSLHSVQGAVPILPSLLLVIKRPQVVLFFEDLQLGDEFSQEVIQSLVDSCIVNNLAIRAYRDDQDDPHEIVIGNVKQALKSRSLSRRSYP